MASFESSGKLSELGDLLLLVRYKGEIKFSFIQAKLVKSAKYSTNHLSFNGNSRQHRLMIGTDKKVYLMGKTEVAFLHKPQEPTITDYLIFYRNPKFPHEYNSDLICARECTNVIGKGKTYITVPSENKNITMHNVFNKAFYYLEFDNLVRAINCFQIGEKLSKEAYKSLIPYLPYDIKTVINEALKFDFPIDQNDNQYKKESKIPSTILIDITSGRLIDDLRIDCQLEDIIKKLYYDKDFSYL